MEELNPIACEHCRSKKCKCDRRIPSCSQCQTSLLVCRYLGGGKRGIPAAYITDLEKRLLDTEAALYTALATLEYQGGNINSATFRWHGKSVTTAFNERSKAEKQDEWKRQPLESKEQLAAWFKDKKDQREYAEMVDQNSELVGDTTQLRSTSTEDDTAREVTSTSSQRRLSPVPSTRPSTHSQVSQRLPEDIFDQLNTFDAPSDPNASQGQGTAAQWRNYF